MPETAHTWSVSEGGLCGSTTFDSRGRLVTLCPSLTTTGLFLVDPSTGDTLATYALPPRHTANPFSDFSGGGYFYIDPQDRVVVASPDRHVRTIQVSEAGFSLQDEVDLSGHLDAADGILSVLPDWQGQNWFASAHGVVGLVPAGGAEPRTVALGEEIANSFAVDVDGAVFVVTTAALYRLELDGDGAPTVVWREPYANTGVQKPGQVSAGSGTTPTVLPDGLVAITDNADPMQVVVYRTEASGEGPRQVCAVPVFGAGAGSTDNSLIGAGRMLIVENNYGYTSPPFGDVGPVTTPGFARVDVRPALDGCDLVWTNSVIAAPTVVPKLSLADGLVYAYTSRAGEVGDHRWYWTALDAATGALVWRVPSGDGALMNNHYAGLALAPNGGLWVGVLGGLAALTAR